jgi:hypothetical protein
MNYQKLEETVDEIEDINENDTYVPQNSEIIIQV